MNLEKHEQIGTDRGSERARFSHQQGIGTTSEVHPDAAPAQHEYSSAKWRPMPAVINQQISCSQAGRLPVAMAEGMPSQLPAR